ncbi:DUF6493 family protein [Stackebrandtia nassauensis]|uniref:DUF7824 domain-containing protein n=1 Tax=Stackebrandtia nassauensis (strain DSM 44728 / CIP 108903 / NRRL B-16338 / NBRC 102104 / LLR-40K-21) TaxID=446470 RepID=D3Q683_STANL|nr:DUF6493 family protein [Stackebrandtia nassauensis]ADD42258.1 hypothetical protein Snas_2578 [Stackebrandtia nassauensis DSM 44728]
MEWNDLETRLTARQPGDVDDFAEQLVRLDDRQRRALSGPLSTFVKSWWNGEDKANVESARLAVVGVTNSAAAVANWLRREAELLQSAWHNFPRGFEVTASRQRTDRLTRVLHARDDAWIIDVFESLAARLRYSGSSEWRDFVVAKVSELGITPPVTLGFTECWIGRYINYGEATYDERLARMRADALLPTMLDALFALDGLGRHFEILLWTDHGKLALPTYLESLMERGDVERGFLIDGCLRRLLRGGRPGDLLPYRKLLESLAATPTEVAERARDFAALLPDAAPATAGVAQKALRSADEAGHLDGSIVVDAAERVLFRPERKIVRDQLSWIDKAVRRHADVAADLMTASAIAFGHDSTDIQSRAVTLVGAHAAVLTPETRTALASQATTLPTAERERLAGILDLEPVPTPEPVAAPDAPGSLPMPEPIASVAELAERMAGLRATLTTDPHGERLDPASIEPVLAALVTFSHRDRPGLAAALKPVLSELDFIDPRWYNGLEPRLLDGVLYAAARAAGDAYPIELDADILYGPTVPEEQRTKEWSTQLSYWRKGLAGMSGPERVLAHRLAEIAWAITERPVPTLVATPTDTIGRIDPSVLIERIERAESEDWQPWELDFQQALLRLPNDADADVIARAAKLTSPAGRRLADWLASRDRPEISVVERPMVMYDRYGDEDDEKALPLATVSIRQPNPVGTQLLDQLRLSFAQRVLEEDVTVERPDWPRTWSAVFPARRDVLAAHLAWLLGPEAYWDLIQPREDRYYLAMLPDLAEADGPTGVSLTTCLAFGLTVATAADRACAVEALTVLAARDQLDAEALADAMADNVLSGLGKCTRIAVALRETAEAGAAEQVWRILATALPKLLTTDPAPNRLADLAELAARTAETVGAHGEIPTIAQTATRRGSSKLLRETRRLHQYLTRPNPSP